LSLPAAEQMQNLCEARIFHLPQASKIDADIFFINQFDWEKENPWP
jgi:hypothetical protein